MRSREELIKDNPWIEKQSPEEQAITIAAWEMSQMLKEGYTPEQIAEAMFPDESEEESGKLANNPTN